MIRRRKAVIVAARRTPVAPMGGALAHLQADELAAPVIRQLLLDAEQASAAVGHVIMGNALYAGGNPARMAALRAGLPVAVPAMTIDTQCCSGLDAILMGMRLIEAGAAGCVIAGGMESHSRAPLRSHRPQTGRSQPQAYERPPFAPPPFEDPDLAEAAARLAASRSVTRRRQAEFAAGSHQKGCAGADKIRDVLVTVPGADIDADGFSRRLTVETALRAPVLVGEQGTGLSAATIACKADAAAAVLMLPEEVALQRGLTGLRLLDGGSLGGETGEPALVPVELGRQLMVRGGWRMTDFAAVEIMEAYAVQADLTAGLLGVSDNQINPLGGSLARGHPIGASGAVLAVQLFAALHASKTLGKGAEKRGLVLIPAAGGLASGLVAESFQSEAG